MSFHGLQEPAILGGDEDDASNDGLVINHDMFLNSKSLLENYHPTDSDKGEFGTVNVGETSKTSRPDLKEPFPSISGFSSCC